MLFPTISHHQSSCDCVPSLAMRPTAHGLAAAIVLRRGNPPHRSNIESNPNCTRNLQNRKTESAGDVDSDARFDVGVVRQSGLLDV